MCNCLTERASSTLNLLFMSCKSCVNEDCSDFSSCSKLATLCMFMERVKNQSVHHLMPLPRGEFHPLPVHPITDALYMLLALSSHSTSYIRFFQL